jgi:hypothetical protein
LHPSANFPNENLSAQIRSLFAEFMRQLNAGNVSPETSITLAEFVERFYLKSLSSKLAFSQPTWTASGGWGHVAASPKNSSKARRIRFHRCRYLRIVPYSSRAQFGQHPATRGTCFSRGHFASMESVICAVRDTRFPANLDSSDSVHWLREGRPCLVHRNISRKHTDDPLSGCQRTQPTRRRRISSPRMPANSHTSVTARIISIG